jgi:hypothetical protein
MKKVFLTSTFLAVIFMSSCIKNLFKEEKEKLPDVTQTGAHTFGCKINGNIWIPNGVHEIYGTSIAALTASFCVEPDRTHFYILISATKDYDSGPESLLIRINSDQAGTYILNGRPDPGYHYPSSGSFGGAETDSLNTGKVTITKIDRINNIIAGTFEFTAFDKRNGNIYNITEGRFDAKTR